MGRRWGARRERSRFPKGMTERKANAKARARADAGVSPLRRAKGPGGSVEMTGCRIGRVAKTALGSTELL